MELSVKHRQKLYDLHGEKDETSLRTVYSNIERINKGFNRAIQRLISIQQKDGFKTKRENKPEYDLFQLQGIPQGE